MNSKKRAFIQLALHHNVLKFGDFTLKSGRRSPYFFNMGAFYDGDALKAVGAAYAESILDANIDFTHLFGPAYKGLPLATATAIALTEKGFNKTVTFNRKEIKTHGEGGVLMGSPLAGKTLIIDDVITAGTAFREASRFISDAGGEVAGVVIALDRAERGLNQQSTLEDIKNQGIPVISIITLYDLLDYLQQTGDKEHLKHIENYQTQYGLSLPNK